MDVTVRTEICSRCHGGGRIFDPDSRSMLRGTIPCPECDGAGAFEIEESDPPAMAR